MPRRMIWTFDGNVCRFCVPAVCPGAVTVARGPIRFLSFPVIVLRVRGVALVQSYEPSTFAGQHIQSPQKPSASLGADEQIVEIRALISLSVS